MIDTTLPIRDGALMPRDRKVMSEAGVITPYNAEHPDQRSILLLALKAISDALFRVKIQPDYAASGVAPVTQALAAAGASNLFTPPAGRGFKAWSRPTGDFNGSYQLECQPIAGGDWIVVLSYAILAATPELQTIIENQTACPYRWNVTARTAGSVTVGLAA
jgi:hypothetical protein